MYETKDSGQMAQTDESAEIVENAEIAESAESTEAAKSAEAAETKEPAPAEQKEEKMGDFEKELEASYKVMGDGEHDTDELMAWESIYQKKEDAETINVEISGVVNKGVIALVCGIRGFIPASRLSLRRVNELNEWLGREIRVRIIEADKDKNKLILSAREILKEERDSARRQRIDDVRIGTIFEGKVESLQDYGAFVDCGDGISGLVHVSQISLEHVKHPSMVLSVGQKVQVKVIGKKEGKISLSMKALISEKKEREETKVTLPKSESIGVSMGDILKNLKL